MNQPLHKLRKSASKADLHFSSIALAGSNTVSQLCSLIASYINHQVLPGATIAGLGIDPTQLGISINGFWHLPNGYGYRPGDINAKWTVQQLADDIDKRVAAAKKAGLPAGH
jgi:hypothetical protein